MALTRSAGSGENDLSNDEGFAFPGRPVAILGYGIKKHAKHLYMFEGTDDVWMDCLHYLRDIADDVDISHNENGTCPRTIAALFGQDQFPNLIEDSLHNIADTKASADEFLSTGLMVHCTCNKNQHRSDTAGRAMETILNGIYAGGQRVFNAQYFAVGEVADYEVARVFAEAQQWVAGPWALMDDVGSVHSEAAVKRSPAAQMNFNKVKQLLIDFNTDEHIQNVLAISMGLAETPPPPAPVPVPPPKRQKVVATSKVVAKPVRVPPVRVPPPMPKALPKTLSKGPTQPSSRPPAHIATTVEDTTFPPKPPVPPPPPPAVPTVMPSSAPSRRSRAPAEEPMNVEEAWQLAALYVYIGSLWFILYKIFYNIATSDVSVRRDIKRSKLLRQTGYGMLDVRRDTVELKSCMVFSMKFITQKY